MTEFNPLSREQKLMAEQVVQLGNIAEAIRAAAVGEDSSNLLNKIDELQNQLATVSAQRAQLQTDLANSQTVIAELQAQLAQVHEGDITPDNINEVMSHLGIEHS